MNKHQQTPDNEEGKDKKDLPGYPIYPASEDIYSRENKVADISPEDDEDPRNPYKKPVTNKDGEDPLPGGDLDVPGAELDDDQEAIGSEDEENNYYSLGGDSHEDLDEGNDDLR